MSSDREQIEHVFHTFVGAGLIEHDTEKVLALLTDDVMGFGMGEQGFVTSHAQVRAILENTVRQDAAVYSLEYEDIQTRLHGGDAASLCARVIVHRNAGDVSTVSGFMQSLTLRRQDGAWKICALHASPIELTRESIASYPLTFANGVLNELRAELKDEIFQVFSKNLSVGLLGAYLHGDNLPPFYINDAMLRMLDYTREDFFTLIADDNFGVVHPDDQAWVQQEILEATARAPAYTCRYRLVTRTGETLWVVEHGKRSKLDGQDVILAAFVEVTELMRLQFSLKEKNETILSSMHYASRIQRSLLPEDALFTQAFSDHAVLWSPKDIVGGDIYWLKNFPHGTLLCVCDCTGHGIPGALLTVLISTFLDSLVLASNCRNTARILYEIDRRGADLLSRHEQTDNPILDVRDGCDIAALFIARDGTVAFSSSGIPVYLCDGQTVKRYRGQRLRIGEGRLHGPDEVERITLPPCPSASYYIATDGLFDQPGGGEGRAFGHRAFEALLLSGHGQPLAAVAERLHAAFEAHRGGRPQRDDMQLLAFRP